MSIWEESEVTSDSNAADAVRAVPSNSLHDAVIAAVSRGWLLSVGGSRDGFSVSLGIIVDGVKERKWHTSSESLERALERVVRAADGPSGDGQPGEAPKARKRSSGRG